MNRICCLAMDLNNRNLTMSYRRRYRNKTVKQKQSTLLKESVMKITKEYCSESSICGLKHLVNEKTPLVERVIWVVTLIGALVCSVTLVWITFKTYYRAPLVTTQLPQGISISKIIFPAIGICTNNRFSKAAVTKLADKLLQEERNKDYNQEEMMSLLYYLGDMYTLGQPVEDKVNILNKLHKALGEYDVDKLMKTLTPRCEDFLLTCSWNEEPKNCSDIFDFRLTSNGYCCTFNYLRQSDTFEDNNISRNIDMYKYGNKSSYDYDQGLKVLLKLNESDDFFHGMPLRGAQLQFSDAYDFPDAPSGSFAMQIVNPHVQMTVLITASFTEASRDIQHIPVKTRQCLFYDESPYLPFYTSSDCMLKCRMLFMLDKCNCTPFNIPKPPLAKTCDISDMACLRRYYAQSISNRPTDVQHVPKELELDLVNGGISCPMCYPTCSKTSYAYDFSNVKIYPEELNATPDSERMDWLRGANFTDTSIIHIKYGRGMAESYGQNVIMKWFDLISNMGSTCGFVTGFSFVSLLEFVYFFTIKLMREVRARRRRQEKNRFNVDSKPKDHYRPIYWNEFAGSSWTGQNALIGYGHRYEKK